MAACAEVGRNQKHPHLVGWKITERASGVCRPTLLAQDRTSRIGGCRSSFVSYEALTRPANCSGCQCEREDYQPGADYAHAPIPAQASRPALR